MPFGPAAQPHRGRSLRERGVPPGAAAPWARGRSRPARPLRRGRTRPRTASRDRPRGHPAARAPRHGPAGRARPAAEGGRGDPRARGLPAAGVGVRRAAAEGIWDDVRADIASSASGRAARSARSRALSAPSWPAPRSPGPRRADGSAAAGAPSNPLPRSRRPPVVPARADPRPGSREPGGRGHSRRLPRDFVVRGNEPMPVRSSCPSLPPQAAAQLANQQRRAGAAQRPHSSRGGEAPLSPVLIDRLRLHRDRDPIQRLVVADSCSD